MSELYHKYARCNTITKDEYLKAKEELSEQEFSENYTFTNESFVKDGGLSEGEIQSIILHKILRWVSFFGIVAVIGLIAGAIYLLDLLL